MNTVTLNTKEFTSEVEWCARFVERKSTIPVLLNILLRKAGDQLHISGTDLELAGVGAVSILESAGGDFELTVPAANLLKYLKKIDESTLQLQPEIVRNPPSEGPHVKGCDGEGPTEGCCEGRQALRVSLTLAHGNSSCCLEGIPSESFPELPTMPDNCFDLAGVERAVERVCASISKDESRFTLNGALLDGDKLISTDGHRLSVCDVKTTGGNLRALLPRKALLELTRVGDSFAVAVDDNHAFFRHVDSQRTIVTRKLTGNFPDWQRVLPREMPFEARIQVKPLLKVIDRVSVFACERSRTILFDLLDDLTIRVERTEGASANGRVAVTTEPRLGTPYFCGFNWKYLVDFLKAADQPEITLRFNRGDQAAQFEVPGWKYVVMPMRTGAETVPYPYGTTEPVPFVVDAIGPSPAIERAPDPVGVHEARAPQPVKPDQSASTDDPDFARGRRDSRRARRVLDTREPKPEPQAKPAASKKPNVVPIDAKPAVDRKEAARKAWETIRRKRAEAAAKQSAS